MIEDSRCPTDVVCVWAGRLVVRTSIDGGAGAETADLVLGEPLDLGGAIVTLVVAEPGTLAGQKIDPSAYRFTFDYRRSN